jgi:hypothetical protein
MDAAEVPNPIRRLTIEALEAKAKRVDEICCPVCGVSDWGVDEPTFYLPVMARDGTPVPDEGFQVAVVSCGKCGLVRLHALSTLLS